MNVNSLIDRRNCCFGEKAKLQTSLSGGAPMYSHNPDGTGGGVLD